MTGLFITLEGGEGTGKSTQARLLAERIKTHRATAPQPAQLVLTREPGGSPQGEALRQLLIQGSTASWSAEAEALLNYAARDAHLRQLIRPALSMSAIVLCDRFMDSTTAYQGYAGGCSFQFLQQLQDEIVGETLPDLTLIFDLDPVLGLTRAEARNQGQDNRFEAKGLAFHEKLRTGFREIAAQNPKRCHLIDASGSVEQVAARLWHAVEPLLAGAGRHG